MKLEMCLIQKIRKLVCWSEQPEPNVLFLAIPGIRLTLLLTIHTIIKRKIINLVGGFRISLKIASQCLKMRV